MRVKVILDERFEEPEARIYTKKQDEQVQRAVRLLESSTLSGYQDGSVYCLSASDILRIYTERQRVFAQTQAGIYQLRTRLYNLQMQLDARQFLRISNAEIVNCDAILRLDVSAAGTIGVELQGGIRTYASRRYVKKIKEFFELGGKNEAE